jgi:hypothetical protein
MKIYFSFQRKTLQVKSKNGRTVIKIWAHGHANGNTMPNIMSIV